MNTATVTSKTVTVISKCKCGRINASDRQVDVQPSGYYATDLWIFCECGKTAQGREARTTAKKCGARCTGATGPVCDCSCGGRNHALHLRGV